MFRMFKGVLLHFIVIIFLVGHLGDRAHWLKCVVPTIFRSIGDSMTLGSPGKPVSCARIGWPFAFVDGTSQYSMSRNKRTRYADSRKGIFRKNFGGKNSWGGTRKHYFVYPTTQNNCFAYPPKKFRNVFAFRW